MLRAFAGDRETEESGLNRLHAQAVDHHEGHGSRYAPLATAGGIYRLISKGPLTTKTVAPLLRRCGFWRRLTPGVRGAADKAAHLMGCKSPYRQLPDSDG